MKLASYMATQAGWEGIFNRLIRLRFGGSFFKDDAASHTEVMFEPGDGVDHLMPDGTTQPDANGAYWFASSAPLDVLPSWSKKRAGRLGGVRFKRIAPSLEKWEIRDYHRDPLFAAEWYKEHEGDSYDWKMVLGFLNWAWQFVIKRDDNQWACSMSAAAAGRFARPDFFHPELMRAIVTW